MRTRLKEAKESNRLAVLSEGVESIESEDISEDELDDDNFITKPEVEKKQRLKTQENGRRQGRTTFKE